MGKIMHYNHDKLIQEWINKFDELVELTEHFENGSDVRQMLLKEKEEYVNLLYVRHEDRY